MKQILCCLILLLPLPAVIAWSCVVEPPSDYFSAGGRDVFDLPEMIFEEEYAHILAISPEAMLRETDDLYKQPSQDFLETDLGDLKACLGDKSDVQPVLDGYASLRQALLEYADALAQQKYFPSSSTPETEGIRPFDLSPYEETLSRLPEEFALYLRGAAAYYNKDYTEARRRFLELLALEAEERHWRSVWAVYMLGKSLLMLDAPADAISCFEQTRQFAQAGFQDSMLLGMDSWQMQGRAAYLIGDYVAALHHYVKFREIPGNRKEGRALLSEAFNELLSRETIPPALAQDELTRQLLTAWICCHEDTFQDECPNWLQVAATLPEEGPCAGADLLAWCAYQCGEMDLAARWVDQSPPDASRAVWVKAKLLLQEGRFDEGTKMFEDLARSPDTTCWRFLNCNRKVSSEKVLLGESAGAKLLADDYTEALKALLLAGEWGDAAFVAERILTVKELRNFIREYKNDSQLLGALAKDSFYDVVERSIDAPSWMILLRHLLARRLAREGRWEAAIKHFPGSTISSYTGLTDYQSDNAIPLAEKARGVANHLQNANDEFSPPNLRARHLFEAALIIRRHGMDLLGTEMAPDWRLLLGCEYYDDADVLARSEDLLTPKAKERIAKSTIKINKRFHYRYVAANLMWECANMLPNNNVLAAEALYRGGTWLKVRDPEAADLFYKALVRRHPNLLIARQADILRWFPREFTELVLYTPAKWHGFTRRKVAYLLTGLLVPVFIAGTIFGKQLRRGTDYPGTSGKMSRYLR